MSVTYLNSTISSAWMFLDHRHGQYLIKRDHFSLLTVRSQDVGWWANAFARKIWSILKTVSDGEDTTRILSSKMEEISLRAA